MVFNPSLLWNLGDIINSKSFEYVIPFHSLREPSFSLKGLGYWGFVCCFFVLAQIFYSVFKINCFSFIFSIKSSFRESSLSVFSLCKQHSLTCWWFHPHIPYRIGMPYSRPSYFEGFNMRAVSITLIVALIIWSSLWNFSGNWQIPVQLQNLLGCSTINSAYIMHKVPQSLGLLPMQGKKYGIAIEPLDPYVAGLFFQYAFVCMDWAEEPVAILDCLE